MNGEPWIPIRYRDFYDIPRAFVIQRGDEAFLFDCPFDDGLDDYAEHYLVTRLTRSAAARVDEPSWQDLASQGSLVGRVAANLVRFDSTRRSAVDAAVLDHLGV